MMYTLCDLSFIVKFWPLSKTLKTDLQDDQVRVNHILYQSGVTWYTMDHCNDISHCTITGLTKNGLNVTLLSQDIICRSCKHLQKHQYFIWHGRASRNSSSKEKKARKENVWFLRENWKDVIRTTRATGSDLIKEITKII